MSRRAEDISPEVQEFLWDDRIPLGCLTVIAGQPNIGKSTLGYRIASDTGVPTIFATTEELSRTMWRPRIEASNVTLARAFHHPELKFGRDPKHVDYLRELVLKYAAKLVIVDPITNHLVGASISRDEQVRNALEPFVGEGGLAEELDFALLVQCHVLRGIPKSATTALVAVPAGLVSLAKAVYLFGPDPRLGADENIRLLATADKYNFGPPPQTLMFEKETQAVRIVSRRTKRSRLSDFMLWKARGPVPVKATQIVVMLRPESAERKTAKVEHAILALFRENALKPVPVAVARKAISALDPPVSWKTAERVSKEMALETQDDPQDARRKLWVLPDSLRELLEETAGSDDEIELREVDVDDVTDPTLEHGDDETEIVAELADVDALDVVEANQRAITGFTVITDVEASAWLSDAPHDTWYVKPETNPEILVEPATITEMIVGPFETKAEAEERKTTMTEMLDGEDA